MEMSGRLGAAEWMVRPHAACGSIGELDVPRSRASTGRPPDGSSRASSRDKLRPGRHLTATRGEALGSRRRSARWDPLFYLVRPLREQCIHYRSQVFANDDEPDVTRPGHRIVFSNCMVRRSVGGAMMSLRDEAVYACEHRHPPDPESVRRHITDWNKERLAAARHLVRVDMFNLPPVTHRHAEKGIAVKGEAAPGAAPVKDPT
jgi:hypothetical protein